ncbi:hypothetical protein BGW80DRAFT_1177811 [Lactifluus volemus]|nr:hypothetical protein BGW80DRAFT_1177811 [Lactifluus volemus]
MTPQLYAEIDQAHSLGVGAGMSGVAYAGGASSGPVSRSTLFESSSLPNESTLERVRSNERPSPREPAGVTAAVQRRDTTRDNSREPWERERDREVHRRGSMKRDHPPMIPTQQPSPKLETQRADSPQYLSALSSPGDHSASYSQFDRELRSAQAAALPPSPPAPRQSVPYMEPLRSTPPSVVKLSTQSPTGQSVKARTPDKSLPVQEEFEEDGAYEHQHDLERQHHTSSPTPSSDLLPEGYDPRYDTRRERNGRETLGQNQRNNSDEAVHCDIDEEENAQNSGRTQSQDEESNTPRSPSASLPPERSMGTRDSPGHSQQRQQPQQHNPNPHAFEAATL